MLVRGLSGLLCSQLAVDFNKIVMLVQIFLIICIAAHNTMPYSGPSEPFYMSFRVSACHHCACCSLLALLKRP